METGGSACTQKMVTQGSNFCSIRSFARDRPFECLSRYPAGGNETKGIGINSGRKKERRTLLGHLGDMDILYEIVLIYPSHIVFLSLVYLMRF